MSELVPTRNAGQLQSVLGTTWRPVRVLLQGSHVSACGNNVEINVYNHAGYCTSLQNGLSTIYLRPYLQMH